MLVMKPSEEIAALEQNAQAKIQFWNAMRKIIPATGTIATDMGQRNDQSQEGNPICGKTCSKRLFGNGCVVLSQVSHEVHSLECNYYRSQQYSSPRLALTRESNMARKVVQLTKLLSGK